MRSQPQTNRFSPQHLSLMWHAGDRSLIFQEPPGPAFHRREVSTKSLPTITTRMFTDYSISIVTTLVAAQFFAVSAFHALRQRVGHEALCIMPTPIKDCTSPRSPAVVGHYFSDKPAMCRWPTFFRTTTIGQELRFSGNLALDENSGLTNNAVLTPCVVH